MNRPASELPLLSKGAKPMNPDGITNLEHAVQLMYMKPSWMKTMITNSTKMPCGFGNREA